MNQEADLVPTLIVQILKDYQKGIRENPQIQKLVRQLENNKATYDTAHRFSVETGSILADLLAGNISPDKLGVDELYWNIIQRVLFETLEENHILVSEFSKAVQTILNERANIKLKPQTVPFDSDAIEQIAGKIVSADDFEKVSFLLKEPIITQSMRIVDRTLQANVEFQKEAGLFPKIRRTLGGKCCDWCNSLVGDYDYTADINDDVFKRHDRCRCKVEYIPTGLRSGGVEIVHSGDGSLTRKSLKKLRG